MKVHPIAECYPALSEHEFQLLKDHIKANGLQNPIVLFENQILDGVHRKRACDELGIKAAFVTPQIADPFEYVIGQNERVRKLTPAQLGIVGERMAVLKRGDNRYTKNLDSSKEGSIEKVAKRLGIGHSTIERIRVVKEHGIPELITAIQEKKIGTTTAERIARLPKENQATALAEKLSVKNIKPQKMKTKRPKVIRQNWRDISGPPASLHKRCELLWHSTLSLNFNAFKTKEERKVACQYLIAACTKMVELIDEVDTLEELYIRTH